MGALANEAKKRSPYLQLEAGESVVAKYKGYKLVPSSYDPTKENFRFILTVNIDGQDFEKFWDSGSTKVAMIFDTVDENDEVKITKFVENPGTKAEKTRWEVEPLKGNGKKTTTQDSGAGDEA